MVSASTDGVKEVTKSVTDISNSVNTTLDKTSKIVDKTSKIVNKSDSIKSATISKIKNLSMSDSVTTNTERIIDKYFGKVSNVLISIFEYAKDPAKELFNLFVMKVRIFAIVDALLGLLFIIFTIFLIRYSIKGIKFINKRSLTNKKVTSMQILNPIISGVFAIIFTITSLTYVSSANQIALDAFVPEYQAIKDVSTLFGEITGTGTGKSTSTTKTTTQK